MRYAKNMQIRGNKHGSALIMVMLVIAGITTIVFATQRIALVQFSQSVREEDNLMAFYAAQAGIEDGLVRYRYERNTEINKDSDNNPVKFRFDLTNAGYPRAFEIDSDVDITDGIEGYDYDPKHQYYDLVIYYKTQRINIQENGDVDFSLMLGTTIAKDDVLTLTGFPPATGSSDNYLRHVFKFVDNPSNCIAEEPFVTMNLIRNDTSSGGVQRDSQQIIVKKPPGSDLYDSSTNSTNLDVSDSGTNTVSSIRIRAYHCNVEFALAATTSNNGRVGGSDTFEFDGLFTEILSTGYFGSTKRTLIAQVNRQTGNLIGIFDFILYAGGNCPSGGNIGSQCP